MLIRTGLGGQLSGSVGGVTASHNRYGQYLRNRTVPVNPNSERQQAVRQCFSECSIAWKSLTNAQRNAWNAYAAETPVLNKLGESVTLSGQAMFVRTNTWLSAAGFATETTAPPSPGLASLLANPEASVVTPTVVALEITGTVTNVAVQMGPPLSAGVTFFRSPYSFVAAEAVAAGGIEVTIPSSFPYGAPVVGQRRPVRITGQDDATRLSNAVELILTVVAN